MAQTATAQPSLADQLDAAFPGGESFKLLVANLAWDRIRERIGPVWDDEGAQTFEQEEAIRAVKQLALETVGE